MSPLKSIKEKCLDCCCFQITEVVKCTCSPTSSHPCPLWNFRLGKNPFMKGPKQTEEQKQKNIAILKNYRLQKTMAKEKASETQEEKKEVKQENAS
jgi:hypothetical protein